MKRVLICSIVFIFSFFAQLAIANESFRYKKVDQVHFDFKIDALKNNWIVKVSHLELTDNKKLNIVYEVANGLLYHKANGEIYYSEGLTKKEFLRLINTSEPFNFYYVLNIFFPEAIAQNLNCQTNMIDLSLPGLSGLDSSFGKINLTQMLKKCDFSFSNIFEMQFESFKDLGSDIFSGNIWNNISNATNSFIKLLPLIKDQVLPAMSALAASAPQLVEKLFCNFTEKKVGAIVLSTFSGGMTAVPVIASTVNDVNKLIEKISILSTNKKLLNLVVDLEKRKLLSKDFIESISKMTKDLPDSLKNPQTNRFRALENRKVHFDKHSEALGVKSELEYEEKAKKFASSQSTNNTISFTEKGGDVIKWDTSTDEMLVVNKYGNFITYFKSNCKNEFEKLLYVILPKDKKKDICNKD